MLPITNHTLDRYLWDRSRGKQRRNQMFAYQGEVSFNGVGDQVTIINLDTDADFVWLGMRGATFFPNTGLPNDPFDAAVLVRYGGLGARGFSQTAVDFRNCCCPRPVPFMLPCGKLMPAGSQFHITVTLRTAPGVLPANIAVQLFGFKPFRWSGTGEAA